MNTRTRILHAFTLIELLIVVAIIAILAAIAVPNFLEAQTRSKVSRAKADMRSLAVAIESYRVDNNQYNIAANEDGTLALPPSGAEWFETRLSRLITTPIAYITSLPNEPFPNLNQGTEPNKQFHYSPRWYALAMTGSDAEFNNYLESMYVPSRTSVAYFLMSHGPDNDHDSPDLTENPLGPSLYDPTNGTTSSGDILFTGPGNGFRN